MSRVFMWIGWALVVTFVGLVIGAIWVEEEPLSGNLADTAGLLVLLIIGSFASSFFIAATEDDY